MQDVQVTLELTVDRAMNWEDVARFVEEAIMATGDTRISHPMTDVTGVKMGGFALGVPVLRRD